MGLIVEKVPDNEFNEVEDFFVQSSISDFIELLPPEMAKFASEHFRKEDYFFAARDKEVLVGAMHFSIQGGVGHLAGIQINQELTAAHRGRIRNLLLTNFIDICRGKRHRAMIWVPYQYRNALNSYTRHGFRKIFVGKNLWYKDDFILLTREF